MIFKKKYILLIAIAVLSGAFSIIHASKSDAGVAKIIPQQEKNLSATTETLAKIPEVNSESIAVILSHARELSKNATIKNASLVELESLVFQAKTEYEESFENYQKAINDYKELSKAFDRELRQGADTAVLNEIDQDLQASTIKVLALGEKSDAAYRTLMQGYDAALPGILEKYFKEEL